MWVEAPVQDSDDEDDPKYIVRDPSQTKVGKRSTRHKIPKKIETLAAFGHITFTYDEMIGLTPDLAVPAASDWYNSAEGDSLRAEVTKFNTLHLKKLQDEKLRKEYGKMDKEEEQLFPINSLVAESLPEYRKQILSELVPNQLRLRLDKVPMMITEEVHRLKEMSQGTDARTLRIEMEKRFKDHANACVGRSLSSLVMEDVSQFNQCTLLHRKEFWNHLLDSNELHSTIANFARESDFPQWAICKLFLVQYYQIINTLETCIANNGQSYLHSSELVLICTHTHLCLCICFFAPVYLLGPINLQDKPLSEAVLQDKQWWSAIFATVAAKFTDFTALSLESPLWQEFTDPNTFVPMCMENESVPASSDLICHCTVTNLVLPSPKLGKLDEAKDAKEITGAIKVIDGWNHSLDRYRRLFLGPFTPTLTMFRKCHTEEAVSYDFAQQWDRWKFKRAGRTDAEPKPTKASDQVLLDIYKEECKWRDSCIQRSNTSNIVPGC